MDDATTGHMMHGIRRVLARGARTVDDVHILMGVARQAMWAAGDARNPEPDARTERCGDGGEAVDLAVVRRDGKTRET
jgi:tRNA C32,U32 (ribose-2'-O)-methylase TrmJ